MIFKSVVPANEARRIVRKFSFLPTRVGNYIIWLGFYDSHQVFGRHNMSWEEEFKSISRSI